MWFDGLAFYSPIFSRQQYDNFDPTSTILLALTHDVSLDKKPELAYEASNLLTRSSVTRR